MGLTTSAYTGAHQKAAQYGAVADKLRTGDLVLFSGNTIESLVVQIGTLSPWSHVGMVFRMPSMAGVRGADPHDLYLWHSYGNAVKSAPDVLGAKPKGLRDGPQLISLSRALHLYKGGCFVRRINDAGSRHIKGATDQPEVVAWMRRVTGTHYERSIDDLFLATYDGPLGYNGEEDESSYFCSELVAETYQRMGLMEGPAVQSPSEYTPYDFSSWGQASRQFIRRVAFSRERRLLA